MNSKRLKLGWLNVVIIVCGLAACRVGEVTPEATRTPRPTFTRVVPTEFFTVTPAPSVTATAVPTGVATVPLVRATTAAPRATSTRLAPTPTRAPAVPSVVSAPVVPAQPPREGGTWDFEGGWYDTPSNFEGRVDRVADEWKFFRRRGEYGQPTFNENKNPTNVHRGIRSQEIAFESSDGEAGVYRTLQVIPNHRYTISAWGIHYPSPTPIEMFLGVDLTGGGNYQATSVQWFPWRETGDSQWRHSQETVRAAGSQMTVFLRALHRTAAGGGAMLFDDVTVTDLGN